MTARCSSRCSTSAIWSRSPAPIVCRNPALAEERARKRGELLDATERALLAIQARVRRKRRPLKGAAAIGEAVGAVLNRKKMAKHFTRTITDGDFAFARNDAAIETEARLDGIYVLRTPVPQAELDAEATVRSYKALSTVERAFRSCNRRPRSAARLPLERGSRPRPRLLVPARLSPRMAHAASADTHPL